MNPPRDLLIQSRNLIRVIAVSGALMLLAAGCSPPAGAPPKDTGTSPAPGTPADVSHGEHGGHGGHGASGAQAPPSTLRISTSPEQLAAGQPIGLSLQITDPAKNVVRRFEPLHEKLAHLIIVRDGLDEFAHLHPDVGDDGTLRVDHPFPKPGRYRLYVDYQPAGGTPSLAVGELTIAGDAPPAPMLVANAATPIEDGGLRAKVDVGTGPDATSIRFRITDADGRPVSTLQPYLGAMGHLVVIRAGSLDYVHAHPANEAKEAPDGTVAFEAHLPSAGLYKAWGQFRHNDRILTFPVVLEIDAGKNITGGHRH